MKDLIGQIFACALSILVCVIIMCIWFSNQAARIDDVHTESKSYIHKIDSLEHVIQQISITRRDTTIVNVRIEPPKQISTHIHINKDDLH